ncbi:hypothetical protein [Pseudoalteromonas piscicida]|uniref:hypothetical protein n=1 Tax=Pseudoalteromonas piscicida TaxID=43662 RepID=UPI0032BF6A66
MSNDNLTMTERLSQVATRANALCQTVEDQVGIIHAELITNRQAVSEAIDLAEETVTNYLSNARGEQSHILLSRNQKMEPSGTSSIRGFNTIGMESFEVTKEGVIHARPENDVDLTGEGAVSDFRSSVFSGYVNGSFNILRVKWKRNSNTHPARIDNNWSSDFQQGALTSACYIKVLNGEVEGAMSEVKAFPNDWQLLAHRQAANSQTSRFYAPHTKLDLHSQEGEILICLFGTVSGFVNLEQSAWGLFPEFARV